MRADEGTSLVSYISRLAGKAVSDTGLQNNITSWTYDGLGREIQQSETVALGCKPGTSTSLGTTTATATYGYTFPAKFRFLDGILYEIFPFMSLTW